MKTKSILLLSLIFIIAGCSTFSVKPDYMRSVGETDAGTTLKAYIGDIIYTKYDYSSRDFTRVTTSFHTGLLPVPANRVSVTDEVFLKSTLNGKPGACGTAQFGIYFMSMCLLDENRDNIFESYELANGASGGLKTEIPYSYQRADKVEGVKKELIYQGIDDETLRFRYREYIQDIVRPAYDQTVEYNISVDNVVSFRGMRILVESATNQDITYKIVSGTVDL
tara:strand:- start:109 stop:777 length:669 start_codon:yes stop_codon:yes gene_type:complete